jgi:GR25 family glycosyltransferase involved in LPS biosynthesis
MSKIKSFIITLMNNDSSIRLSNTCFESLKTHGYDPNIFKAHCGKDSISFLDSKNIKPIFDESMPHYQLYKHWSSVLGTIGCFASHFDLWLTAVKLQEPIIILEHDAIVVRPWDDPNWKDILHLDWEGSLRRRHMRNAFDQYNPVVKNSVYNMGFRAGEAASVVSMNCAYAYAITPEAAEKLIQDVLKRGFFAVDRFIREPIVSIETIHPKIAEEQPEALEMFTTST